MSGVVVVKGAIAFVVCVAVLLTNIPVIVLSSQVREFLRLIKALISRIISSLVTVHRGQP